MARRRVERADPRVVGGRYLNGYWQMEYTVVAIHEAVPVWGVQWTVKWANGSQTTHSTAWDWRRDKVVSTPEPLTDTARSSII